MSSLERQPGFGENVRAILVKFGHDLIDRWDDWMRGILRARFMFADDYILISWNSRLHSRSEMNEKLTWLTLRQLPDILATITPESPGWLHQLSGLQDELKDMLSYHDYFRNVPVNVLELETSHNFWSGTFEVMGE
jgi:hypothetical protein